MISNMWSDFKIPNTVAEDEVYQTKLRFEDEMEAIWRSEHSLQEFVATDYYKSYEDLNKRFTQVVTGKSETSAPGRAFFKSKLVPRASCVVLRNCLRSE